MIRSQILIVMVLFYCHQQSDSAICNVTRTVYTKCGGAESTGGGGRWRVFVPDIESDKCTPPPPVRVAPCDKTCGPGEVLTDVTDCKACPSGSYSPGNELVYPLPDPAVHPDISFLSTKIDLKGQACPNIWTDLDSVVLPTSLCNNVINIPFHLLQPGTLNLRYLFPDDRMTLVFNLKSSSSQSCNDGVTTKSLQGDQSFDWQTAKMSVPSSGQFLLEIKSTAYFNTEPDYLHTTPLESPRIGKFSVTGVAPYTECSACPSGTYTDQPGSSECKSCSQNTYLGQDSKCVSCELGYFAPQTEGNPDWECLPQETCPESEFVPVVGQCNGGVSKRSWKEAIVGKCSNPIPSQKQPCQECQPGQGKVDGGKCEFCPDGSHNSGLTSSCSPCSPNTISLRGLYYVWWEKIPEKWVLRCPDCWFPAGDYLLGRTRDYQPISIDFGVVDYSSTVITSNVVGLFSIQFRLVCPEACLFIIVKEHSVNGVKLREVIESYDESIGETDPEIARVSVLEKSSDTTPEIQQFSVQLSGVGASVQLLAVNFTNTKEGGSSYCFPCSGAGCKECAPGMIYEDSSPQEEAEGKCIPCPENTYHVISGSVLTSDYSSRCVVCPAGTLAKPGSTTCYTPCSLTLPSSHNSYDVSVLSDVMVYDQPNSFPDKSGDRFHYRYTMKICSEGEVSDEGVECGEDSSRNVRVCQLNVVTKSNGDETVSNPIVKGDVISRISEDAAGKGVVISFSSSPVTACDSGLVTNVTLRCNRDHTGVMRLEENTDCRLSFVYDGPFGCRLCADVDYESILSSCVDGTQNKTFVRKEGVVCLGGVPLPAQTTQPCTPYHESLSASIKRFKLYIVVGVALFVLLILGLCLLGFYSSSLKHKLDGYAQLSYANDDNYTGVRGGPNNNFVFADTDSEDNDESGDTFVFAKSGGRRTPGNIISDRLNRLHDRLKPGNREDIMQLTSSFEI